MEKLITILKSDEKMENWIPQSTPFEWFTTLVPSIKEIVRVVIKMGEIDHDGKETSATLKIGEYIFTHTYSERTQSENMMIQTTQEKINEVIW